MLTRRSLAGALALALLAAPVFWERRAADDASALIVWSGFPEPRVPVLLDPETGETFGDRLAESNTDLLESLRGSSPLPIRTPLIALAAPLPAHGQGIPTSSTCSVFCERSSERYSAIHTPIVDLLP